MEAIDCSGGSGGGTGGAADGVRSNVSPSFRRTAAGWGGNHWYARQLKDFRLFFRGGRSNERGRGHTSTPMPLLDTLLYIRPSLGLHRLPHFCCAFVFFFFRVFFPTTNGGSAEEEEDAKAGGGGGKKAGHFHCKWRAWETQY